MEKIKKTFREIFEYNSTVAQFFKRNPKNENTHLAVAINRLAPSINKGVKPYNKLAKKWNKKMEDLKSDYASTDSDGVLQFDMVDFGNGKVREYKYKATKFKELGDKLNELEEAREQQMEEYIDNEFIEFFPKFSVSIPSDLTEWEKEIFSGIVIDPKMLENTNVENNIGNGKSEKSELDILTSSHNSGN